MRYASFNTHTHTLTEVLSELLLFTSSNPFRSFLFRLNTAQVLMIFAILRSLARCLATRPRDSGNFIRRLTHSDPKCIRSAALESNQQHWNSALQFYENQSAVIIDVAREQPHYQIAHQIVLTLVIAGCLPLSVSVSVIMLLLLPLLTESMAKCLSVHTEYFSLALAPPPPPSDRWTSIANTPKHGNVM